MWPYWLFFLMPALMVISNLSQFRYKGLKIEDRRWSKEWQIVFVFLILIIGLRHEVGGDWINYLLLLDSYDNTLSNNISYLFQDPAFILFNQLAIFTQWGIYLVNVLSAIFFSWGLTSFCRSQPRPWLALLIAVPYLITVVAMGYTRQGVAIGIAMIAMLSFTKGNIWSFVIWIGIAATFHKSALILLPLAALASTEKRFFTFVWVSLASLLLYVLLLQDAMSNLIAGYIESNYQSSGAAIRIAMNAVPATLFLIFRKNFKLSYVEKSFWTWLSSSAIFLILVLVVSPSSTAVDRVALYWIPIQIFVLSRLPDALGSPQRKNTFWVILIVCYCALVHFVWLIYAETSFAWIPYQFYPWVWLWQ